MKGQAGKSVLRNAVNKNDGSMAVCSEEERGNEEDIRPKQDLSPNVHLRKRRGRAVQRTAAAPGLSTGSHTLNQSQSYPSQIR